MKTITRTLMVAAAVTTLASAAAGYPLSGYERTGIRRLWAYSPEHREALGAPNLPAGAKLDHDAIRLRMAGNPDYSIGATDPQLQAGLEAIFAERDPTYSIAMLDVTEPGTPRFAALRADTTYLPGSIGKLLVAVGLFDALARAYPSIDDRMGVLRSTWVTADDFVRSDSHRVPIADPDAGTLVNRPIQPGDRFTLFEWIDHALSPSSNAAGATMWREAMLLRHFGSRYPVGDAEWKAWLADTGKAELTELALETIETQLRALDLDTAALRQGTMFTAGGRAHVPGVRSLASPQQLLRLLLRLEQGRVVDSFSSLEIKRLLYYTKGRYRYAVSPALNNAAVYFKSGSFYRCGDEAGFQCRQYAGNVENVMNSVAIVESPASPAPGQTQRVYLVALMSNVLRLNSAAEHRDLATEIDRLVASLHP